MSNNANSNSYTNGNNYNCKEGNNIKDKDKYKNMQGIGSDMLNNSNNQTSVSINSYNNCKALSSDQLFGKNEATNSSPGISDYLATYEWEDKIRNAKDLIAHKSTSIYNKLRDKWNGLN